MGKRKVRIGSRKSRLAVWQANHIKELIEEANPDIEAEVITITTEGDRILDRPLEKIGGKGLFVKELDLALLEKKTDISVHSLKDMPMDIPAGLPILVCSRREDPRDALILREGITEDRVRVIASSSRRRMVQYAGLYPYCSFIGMRGNIQTRMRKLDEYGADAIILAAAGLKRMGMEAVISRVFDPEEMIPAAGQGILAVQGRAGEDYDYLSCVMDYESQTAARAERAFVRALNGGCSSPIAAYATIQNRRVLLRGMYYDESTGRSMYGEISGSAEEAGILGKTLAEEIS